MRSIGQGRHTLRAVDVNYGGAQLAEDLLAAAEDWRRRGPAIEAFLQTQGPKGVQVAKVVAGVGAAWAAVEAAVELAAEPSGPPIHSDVG
jgi:hypothetical protein